MQGLLWWLSGKAFACQCRRHGFHPWSRKMPWRRKWLPTQVILPGKSHGQKRLAGYGPWSHKESTTTEWPNNSNYRKELLSSTMSPMKSCRNLLSPGATMLLFSGSSEHGQTWRRPLTQRPRARVRSLLVMHAIGSWAVWDGQFTSHCC